jgi:sulfatase maturation enzyme AslB (radical SAM superfamily)
MACDGDPIECGFEAALGQLEASSWIEYMYGDHDWHRPDPLVNPCCRRCGIYTGRDCGDGCRSNIIAQRTHYVGSWKNLQ